MKIVVGSTNPTKVKAVREVFTSHDIEPQAVPSHVSPQPMSDVETRKGAINRASQCVLSEGADIGIGLEGGVMEIDGQLFVCNWGALVTKNQKLYTASGARIVLPIEFAKQLKAGKELGDLMDTYASREGVRKKEGAIGIFTNDHVSRQEIFEHVLTLLRGQWEYWSS
ncbi:DUF84 family protein [Oceanobacillus manasiensis]|uniref:DUF84 family protein n=1 Tax=Oceanobacillus manasiensis TaxID=586413 RepID=UPI0005AA1CBC|nr:DUF84 family protein [Oceanobacillus manasiensis]